MLAFDAKSNSWHLYEVKGTNAVHEGGGERNHLDDLAFQLSVLKRSRVSVAKCGVIHLSSEYARAGDLDIERLFKMEDVTDQVVERLPVVEEKMATALDCVLKKPSRRKAASASTGGEATNAPRSNIQARTCVVQFAS